MEHPCNQCGATVEDGTPFCRQCRAPQIRVAGVESAVAAPSVASGTEEPQFPYRESVSSLSPAGVIQWPRAFRSAAAAGTIGAALMFTPLGGLGLGMVAGGFLAVALYRRRDLGASATPASGVKLGLLTGAIGFGFFSLFLSMQIAVFHKGGELRSVLIHSVEQAVARSNDPQAQAVAGWLKSPEGLTFMIVASLLFTLIVFLVLGSLGGALGAVMLRGRRRNG